MAHIGVSGTSASYECDHAGTALLAEVADKLGLTRALSKRLTGIKQRRRVTIRER